MLLPTSIRALLHIATFAVFASAAKSLAFNSPSFSKVAASGYPYFNIGDSVKISWSTEFEQTTLLVYQKVKVSGKYFYELLADSNGPDNTTYTWIAGGINGHPLIGALFHFFLQNSNNFTCDTCYLNSQVFQLYPGTPGGTTSSEPPSTRTTLASTGTTLASTGTTLASTGTNTAISSQSGGAAGVHSPGDVSASKNSSTNLGVPLGVGLGVGIPVSLALIGILLLFRHRRKQQEKDVTKGPAFEDITPSSTPQMKQRGDDRFSRESGALGPWMQNPSPNWEQQEAWERERWEQQPQQEPTARNPSRLPQRQDYIPFQPLTTHSEASRESSRHSWIDQFDFERPGYRDADELSEVRRSIHEAPREDPSMYAQSAYSHASIGDVSEIPQVPQPVHQTYPDDNWPLR